MIHILKALDINYWKIQEKVEIIRNHIHMYYNFGQKYTKNQQCEYLGRLTLQQLEN